MQNTRVPYHIQSLLRPVYRQAIFVAATRCNFCRAQGARKRGHIVVDILLPTQMFPRSPARATFVADTNFVSGTQKMFQMLFRNILCPQQMFPSLRSMETQHSFCVPRVCAPKKHHEQQCVLVCQGLATSFKHVRNPCDIAATKRTENCTCIVSTCDFGVATQARQSPRAPVHKSRFKGPNSTPQLTSDYG